MCAKRYPGASVVKRIECCFSSNHGRLRDRTRGYPHTMSDAEQSPPTIDWPSATVEDGDLSVPLLGETPKGWNARFRAVLAHLQELGETSLGKTKLARSTITVSDVPEGAKSDLHHLLESVVRQVNSDLVKDDDSQDDTPEAQRDRAQEQRFRDLAA